MYIFIIGIVLMVAILVAGKEKLIRIKRYFLEMLRLIENLQKMTNTIDYKYIVNIEGDIFSFYTVLNDRYSDIIKECVGATEYTEMRKIGYQDGDIVIDIGAHIGVNAIYLAKKYPNIKIICLEPAKRNFDNLVRNIKENNVSNITPLMLAFDEFDNKEIDISVFFPVTMGSSNVTMFRPEIDKINSIHYKFDYNKAKTISLNSLIKQFEIKKIKFLKTDCEGAEFALYKFDNFDIIENFAGELHGTKNDTTRLAEFLKSKIKNTSFSYREMPLLKYNAPYSANL